MRRRRAIVHAGLEKTGTTTIQTFLTRNRNILASQGFHVPTTLGQDSHVKLCGLAQDPKPRYPTMWNILGITDADSRSRFIETTTRDLKGEMEQLPASIHTVLFSNEHLHSNLLTSGEVANLKQVLEPYFSSISILFYIRRQDRIASSLYSTRIKGGESIDQPVFMNVNTDDMPYYFDFYSIFQNYESVFGASGLIVRRLEPRYLIGGDLIKDYCECVGIVTSGEFAPNERKNESLQAKALYVLSLLNSHIPPFIAGRWNPHRNALVEILEEHYPASKPIGERSQAHRFYQNFLTGNEQVRQKFMPLSDGPLFDESFDDYPESIADLAPTPSEMGEIFACLWKGRGPSVTPLGPT